MYKVPPVSPSARAETFRYLSDNISGIICGYGIYTPSIYMRSSGDNTAAADCLYTGLRWWGNSKIKPREALVTIQRP